MLLDHEERLMHKGLLLDLDNTVRQTYSGKVCPNHPSDQYVMEGRYDKIWDYKKKGYKIIGVSNQGGIGLGYMTDKRCREIMDDLDEKLGGAFDKIYYAPAHPKADHPLTKPNPGMIHQAVKELNIDLKKSIMVGDRDSDKEAAKRAGVKFHWADDFFSK
jgi:D-glycero-D-manno-heptose 1,7-bisphosphate phosphatase